MNFDGAGFGSVDYVSQTLRLSRLSEGRVPAKPLARSVVLVLVWWAENSSLNVWRRLIVMDASRMV